MKRKFSTIFGVGLVLVLAIALAMPMAVQAKTLDWGEEDLPVVRGITETLSGKTITPLYDILGLSAANDGKTIYAVVEAEAGHGSVGQVVFRSTNGGESWSKKSPKTPSDSIISHVAVSPDDPTVVVAAGTAAGKNYAWISTDKAETWSESLLSGELLGTITSIAISEERDDIRWVAVGSSGGDPTLQTLFEPVQKGSGKAEWSFDEAYTGSSSVKLHAKADSSSNYGKVVMPLEMDFADLDDFSVWVEGGTTAQALPLLDIEMDIADTATSVNLTADNGNNPGPANADLAGKIVQIASQPGQSEDLSPTLMSDGIAGWEQYGTHTGADIKVGTGDYWSIFVYDAERKWEATYDYYTWDEIHTALDDYAAVYDVKVELRYPQNPADTDSTVYVDDITINDTTYELEKFKCQQSLAVARAEAFASWVDASDWGGFSIGATGGVLAVAFSPWFNNDNTLLVVTVDGSKTWLQAAEVDKAWTKCKFNAFNPSEDFEAYPVEIGTPTGIHATVASISLPDTYYGYDPAERIAYIGTDLGVYRMDDDVDERIKSGSLPSVAYNSDENQLLVGYDTSGRVDMSSNPDSGSPTFTRPASMKSPSGEVVSGVAWLGTSMICSTIGAESAFSVSDDARAWSQLSLIDTDLDNITDVAVSEDGSRIYVASQNSADTYYSIWRYASSWERVLCEKFATGQTSVIVRLAPEKPEVVFVGLLGGTSKEIRRSTDSGETWKQSRSDIVIKDMVAKDDKIVFTVDSGGKVSTSIDGGRTFRDYVKSNVSARHIIVAPNGDVLIAGEDLVKSPTKISVALSTDDGATWSRMPLTTGLEEYKVTIGPPIVFNPLLVAADTDYATNNLIYIAHTDSDDDANILRWEVGGDYEVWQDIGDGGLDKDDVISGLVAHEGMLYVAYYNDSEKEEEVSGFVSTNNPTAKRTSVTWGGGLGTDAEVEDVLFTLTPQALKVSSGSIKLWAIDTRVPADTLNRLYSYTDILGKVEAPTVTGPADKYKATVDAALQKINPVKFSWEEVNPDVKYQLRIATNAKMSQHLITYLASTSEYITICEGSPVVEKGIGKTNDYPFASGETYYWRVRVSSPTVGPWSETRSFTIEEAVAPVAPAPVVTVKPPEVTVQAPPAPPAPKVTVEAPAPAPVPAPAIPAYLLWTIIGIGAVLIIALIILIVRTRRVV